MVKDCIGLFPRIDSLTITSSKQHILFPILNQVQHAHFTFTKTQSEVLQAFKKHFQYLKSSAIADNLIVTPSTTRDQLQNIEYIMRRKTLIYVDTR